MIKMEIKNFVIILLLITVVFLLCAMISVKYNIVSYFDGASMCPTMSKLGISVKYPTNDLNVGDIGAFYSNDLEAPRIMHRVIKKFYYHNNIVYVFAGDNPVLRRVDVVSSNRVFSKLLFEIPLTNCEPSDYINDIDTFTRNMINDKDVNKELYTNSFDIYFNAY